MTLVVTRMNETWNQLLLAYGRVYATWRASGNVNESLSVDCQHERFWCHCCHQYINMNGRGMSAILTLHAATKKHVNNKNNLSKK